ncbi:hypothetical protein AVEN_86647-1 [Araneus ventricosus]|uniref:Carboxylesterase type B domain-containing protein n=1 Tax=Araneus ventricosus TaxID=182803 RepID=A0A4Y2RX65_ARAVE|nr:hypothetical protein AVEN_86647-1 [Araneus ventricosus]
MIITKALHFYFIQSSFSQAGPVNFTGIYGMVMALQWMHDDIEFFGGDKNSITVHGQNVGSLTVSLFCVSTLTKGLFSRDILGSALATFLKYDQKEPNLNLSQRIVKAIGCTTGQKTIKNDPEIVVSCLRSMVNVVGRNF